MDKDAAFDALSATWHVFPPMQLFILRRQELVKCKTMPAFGEMRDALQTLRDACGTAHAQLVIQSLDMLADNRLVFPDDTMPNNLYYGQRTNGHSKGYRGNLEYNGAIHSTAQQLRAIIAR